MKSIIVRISLLLLILSAAACGGSDKPTTGGNQQNATTGTATLSWSAPTTNDDGSQLADLAGYKIRYGTSPGNYTETVDVGNMTSYQVTNLPFGATYYFVITAYTSAGVESEPSAEGKKAFNYTVQGYM